MPNVYEARHKGREYCCDTEGSDHYKEGGLEPLDLMIAKGIIEDFCIGNMIKYATRFKVTRNLADLRKVSDYAHILCGVKLSELKADATVMPAVAVAKNTMTVWHKVAPWDSNDKFRLGNYCVKQSCANCMLSEKHNRERVLCTIFAERNPDIARAVIAFAEVKK